MNTEKSNYIKTGLVNGVLVLCLIFISLYGLWLIREIVIALIISIVVALLGHSISSFLQHKLKLPSTLSALITIAVLLSTFSIILFMVIPLLLEQAESLSTIETRTAVERVKVFMMDLLNKFKIHSFDKTIKDFELGGEISSFFVSNIISGLNGLLNFVASFFFTLFFVIFVSFFLIKDYKLIRSLIFVGSPNKKEIKYLKTFEKITRFLSRYVVGLFVQFLIMFTLYLIILIIFGINNAFFIAFVCGIINLIPYVGPIINFFLITVFCLTNNLGSETETLNFINTVYVLICFVGTLLIDALFNQPLIYSKSVRSHPLEIFIIIMVFGQLFGVLGMIVAVPTYTVIKVILKIYYPENKVINFLTRNI